MASGGSSSSKMPDDPLQRQRTPSPLPDSSSKRTSPLAQAGANDTGAQRSSSNYLAPSHQPLIRFDDDSAGPSGDSGTDGAATRSQRLQPVSSNTSSRQASPRTTPRRGREASGILVDSQSSAMSSPTRGVGRQTAAHEDSKPGRIALPPEVDNFAHRERDRLEAVRTPDRSPGEPRRFDESGRIRRLSFKRRRGLDTGSERSGPGSAAANFFKRASIASGLGKRRMSGNTNDARNSSTFRRANGVTGGGGGDDDDDYGDTNDTAWERKPRIPSLMPAAQTSPNTTPIPTVPFVVLCLVCFGEFSSAGVAGPFLFFQIESFNVGGESDVAYWAGVVASVFFFAQFLTSMLWASAAQKHGRRAVLLVSLLGNAITLVLFGTATNLKFAISVRLAQGLFNGAVGVAKGAIRDLTDETNEGRAMAQLGFAWGMGGIIGPLIGGLLCNPRDKFPWLVSEDSFLATYPYVLPCLTVASFTATGAFLTLFIGYDGGPRTGAIYLPEKVDIERVTNRAASVVGSLRRSAGQRGSGYFADDSGAPRKRYASAPGDSMIGFENTNAGDAPRSPMQQASNQNMPRTFTQQVDDETGGPPTPLESDDEDAAIGTRFTANDTNASGFTSARGVPRFARSRLMSRTTARHRSILGTGSAYGYEGYAGSVAGSAAPHRLSVAGGPSTDRRSLLGVRGGGHRQQATSQYAPDFEDFAATSPQKLTFAQRFLLANDDAVLGLSDLWVAAAINGDDAYAAEEEEDYDDFGGGLDYGEDAERSGISYRDDDLLAEPEDVSVFDRSESRESTGSAVFGHDEADDDSPLVPRHLPPLNFARKHRLSSGGAMSRGSRPGFRRQSSAGGRVPSVYNNTGIENTGLLSPGTAWPPSGGLRSPGFENQAQGGGYDPTLAGIPESISMPGTVKGKDTRADGLRTTTHGNENASQISAATITQQQQQQQQAAVAAGGAAPPSTGSIMKQLPLAFIAHYCLLGFHSSTFDQVFMAYLVTPFASGGLGLTAAHYAELIAAMAFFQIGFQFYFYPKVGPPQGKLSHLSMMRLGTMMYLPVYVLFASLRIFLHPTTDALVMAFMILFAAMRLLANVCAFTSVSILMNATTQPHLVPLANGLAQTISSACRFLGPLLGGSLWARGIAGGYETHSWPFNYWLGFEVVGLLGFSGFLHSWLIR